MNMTKTCICVVEKGITFILLAFKLQSLQQAILVGIECLKSGIFLNESTYEIKLGFLLQKASCRCEKVGVV
jgi:hypothetical protein